MRWKCTCAYDGTRFCGWQSQSNRQSVQDALEVRLAMIFKRFIRIHGSSRTDAGVHARAQVFHFDADWPYGADRLMRAIQAGLTSDICITAVSQAPSNFHARFSATGKCYHYYFQQQLLMPFEARYVWRIPYPTLNIACMQEAAQWFLGTHSFVGFAGHVMGGENATKTIWEATIVPHGQGWVFVVSGSGFLYRMVRMLFGALVMCGIGKITPLFIRERLALRQLQMPILTAPAHGLFLEKVFYDDQSSA